MHTLRDSNKAVLLFYKNLLSEGMELLHCETKGFHIQTTTYTYIFPIVEICL